MRTDLIRAVCLGLIVAAATLCAAPVQARQVQDEEQSVSGQLEEMKRQLDAVRQENQAMRSEIDELRVKSEDNWLTEARSEEIKGLVADVLADSDTRSSLLQNGLTAGWSDHFFLADPNGRFALFLDGTMQFRWIYNYVDRTIFSQDPDQHRQGFELARTRLTFRGHVFSEDMQYLVRTDFYGLRTNAGIGTAALLDAWIRYNMTDDWSVRAGQFKIPFNREELVAPEMQLAVERSLVNEGLNLGRSQGVELTYASGASRFEIATTDGPSGGLAIAPYANQSRTNLPALVFDIEYDVTARYEHLLAGNWEQFRDFTSPPGDEYGMLFGLAAHAHETEATGTPSFAQTSTRQVSGTADLSVEFGGANLFGSAIYHYIDNPAPGFFDPNLGIVHTLGIVVQGGIYVSPKWELFARGEYGQIWGDSGSVVNVPDLGVLTVGANYYLEGHDLKWTTDFGITTEPVLSPGGATAPGWIGDLLTGWRGMSRDSDVQVVFRTQFQLLF